MAGTNHKLFFRLVEMHFLTNPSFHLLEKDFLFIPSTLLESSLLLAKTATDMSGNHFLKTDLIFATGNSFSNQWKPRSSSSRLMETHFSVQKKKYFFLLRTFFSWQCKPLFKLQGSLFKTLLNPIGNDFLSFFRYFCQCKQFFGLPETYS